MSYNGPQNREAWQARQLRVLQGRTVQLRRDPDEPTLERCTVLAPNDSIAELDQAILAGGSALAQLVKSMFALRLSFRQQPR